VSPPKKTWSGRSPGRRWMYVASVNAGEWCPSRPDPDWRSGRAATKRSRVYLSAED